MRTDLGRDLIRPLHGEDVGAAAHDRSTSVWNVRREQAGHGERAHRIGIAPQKERWGPDGTESCGEVRPVIEDLRARIVSREIVVPTQPEGP